MNPTPRLANQGTPFALVILALLAAAGFFVGWLLPPAYSHRMDQVGARLSPALMGALCIGLIRLQVKQRRASLVATLLCCASFVAALLTVLRH
jgi:peptidoglycan/LPS O-acetylase OafA/YrhL